MNDGDFWSYSNSGENQNAIETLLEQESPDLEKVMNDEGVIQECKYMNEVLTKFLSKPEVLKQLIRYIVEIPEDADERTAQRFPYVASELFACEVSSMVEGLFADPSNLDLLFSFVKNPGEIDPRHSGYFRKVVGVLIERNFSDLLDYLQGNPDLILAMADKIRLQVFMELVTLIGWDISTDSERDLSWIEEAKLVPRIISHLSDRKAHPDTHENASLALQNLADGCGPTEDPNPLLKQLESKTLVSSLVKAAVSPDAPPSASLGALRVLTALLSRPSPPS